MQQVCCITTKKATITLRNNKGYNMKNWKVTIMITNMFGVSEKREVKIKAKTIKSAEKKAWSIIGNQTGHITLIIAE